MNKHKLVTITQEQAALYLATKPQRKRYRADKKLRTTSSAEDISSEFLGDFTPERLLTALTLKTQKAAAGAVIKERVDLCWVVGQLLGLLKSGEAKVAEKISILDRLRDLILLVALQDKDLALEMSRITSGEPVRKAASGRDPFNIVIPMEEVKESSLRSDIRKETRGRKRKKAV